MSHQDRLLYLRGLDRPTISKLIKQLVNHLKVVNRPGRLESDAVEANYAYWDVCVAADRSDLVAACLQKEPMVTARLDYTYEHGVKCLNSGDRETARRVFEMLSAQLYRPDRCHFYLACISAAESDLEHQAQHLAKAEFYYAQLHPTKPQPAVVR